MLKPTLIFCGLFLFYSFLFSQERDSFYMANLYQKAQHHIENNRADSCIHYASTGQKWSEENKANKLLGNFLHLLGKAHFQKNDIPLSLRYFLQTLKIKEPHGNEEELSRLHFELADLYEYWSVHEKSIQHYEHVLTDHQKGDQEIKKQALSGMARNQYLNKNPKDALQYYKQLQSIYELEKDQRGLAETLQNIIKIHKEQGDYNLALTENEKVLTLNEAQKDTAEIIVALNNIGVLHRQRNNLEEALNYFIRSADLQTMVQSYANPTTLTNIGILYQNQRNYQQSLRYLFEAEQTIKGRKTLVVSELAGIHNLISIVYLSMNDLNNAFIHNQQAITLAKSCLDKNFEQVGYKTRASIYEQFNDYEQALVFFQKHTTIKDSLLIRQQFEKEQNLLKQFSAEQTEKEISLLAIDREIEGLKFQQDLLENEKLRQEQALQQSLLIQERLEKDQAEQNLRIAQQELEKKKSEQQLVLTQQQLLAEQKDRQIASLAKEQSQQALELAKQELEAEQKDKAISQSKRAEAELQLSLKEKDFELENQRQTSIRNFAIGFLALALIILGLLYRTMRIRKRSNNILAKQKVELETALSDLQQTQVQLVQSEKMASLGQLTAGVAHEINNPINFITTSIDALKYDVDDLQRVLNAVVNLSPDKADSVDKLIELREQLDVSFLKEEVGELISNIEIGANRTHGIVTALRTYSRDTSERFIPADVHEGIDSSLVILNHKKGNRIQVHKSYGSIPQISCMASRLNQVFLNILDNAIQAIEGEGDIYISTFHNKDNTVSIQFRDTGSGMSEDSINNAFNPFFTTKDVGAGTGLGLYVSYNIIQQHNGTISINSTKGEGTAFEIVLPIKQEDQGDQ